MNGKVLGMFKDEAGGKQIVGFVGLRAKLYSYKMDNGKEEEEAKGVKKGVIKREITFEDYKECLFGGKTQYRVMNTCKSRGHEVYNGEDQQDSIVSE